MTTQNLFTAVFNKTTRTIAYNPAWENGTGYYDHAVKGEHAPKMLNGDIAKSASPNGTRLLIVGTRLGNAVTFDHSHYGKPTGKFVYNSTNEFNAGGWFRSTELDIVDLALMLGDPEYNDTENIGQRMENLLDYMKQAES